MHIDLTNISHILLQLFLQYKYWLLFPITVVEGPLITMASGFLVSMHLLNPFIALPIIIAGDLTGDIMYYFIGVFGERWKLTRWLLTYFKFEHHKEKVTHSFKKHGGKLLLFGKITHALGIVFLIGAGYAGMDIWSFVWYSLIGTAIKSSALMYVGFLAGSAYEKYAGYFEYGSLWVAGISVGIIVFGLLVQHYFVSRSSSKKDENIL